MMDINPDTNSNTAPQKPAKSAASKASGVGAGLSKAGQALSEATSKIGDTAAAKASSAAHDVDVPKQATAPTSFHKGGSVKKSGVYRLKKGEHVLTEPEVGKVRSHAMLAAGLKSLAKSGPKKA